MAKSVRRRNVKTNESRNQRINRLNRSKKKRKRHKTKRQVIRSKVNRRNSRSKRIKTKRVNKRRSRRSHKGKRGKSFYNDRFIKEGGAPMLCGSRGKRETDPKGPINTYAGEKAIRDWMKKKDTENSIDREARIKAEKIAREEKRDPEGLLTKQMNEGWRQRRADLLTRERYEGWGAGGDYSGF